MVHLEKLCCEEITEELQQAYDEIQDNAHLYLNTSFELDDYFDFEEAIAEEFE